MTHFRMEEENFKEELKGCEIVLKTMHVKTRWSSFICGPYYLPRLPVKSITAIFSNNDTKKEFSVMMDGFMAHNDVKSQDQLLLMKDVFFHTKDERILMKYDRYWESSFNDRKCYCNVVNDAFEYISGDSKVKECINFGKVEMFYLLFDEKPKEIPRLKIEYYNCVKDNIDYFSV